MACASGIDSGSRRIRSSVTVIRRRRCALRLAGGALARAAVVEAGALLAPRHGPGASRHSIAVSDGFSCACAGREGAHRAVDLMQRVTLTVIAAIAGAAAFAGVVLLRGGSGAEVEGSRCGPQPRHAEPKLDRRLDAGRPAPFLRDYDPEAVSVALAPDSIRAIDRPCHETAAEAGTLLPDSSQVIGVERGGETRAYPVDLLALHEVVNDVVGGDPVAVTWCPLCATSLGFERRVDGRTLTFGVSGYLHKSNLVLFDRETGSLWSQLLGGAVTGRLRGHELRRLPLVQTTWAEWKKAHPDTRVLSMRRDPLGWRFTSPGSYSTALGIEETNAPYGSYVGKVPVYFPHTVRGVPEASLVLGISLEGRQKAWPLTDLDRVGLVQDELGGIPLALVAEPDALAAFAYSRRIDERVLELILQGRELVDRETRSRFSVVTGRAVSGPLAGETLARVPATTAYWFAWGRAYPNTSIWIPRPRNRSHP